MIDVLFDDQPATQYLEEILAQAGLSWRRVSPSALTEQRPGPGIVLLGGRGVADRALRDWLIEFVGSGGVVIAAGGDWGLADLLGVSAGADCAEGYLDLDPAHPITAGRTGALHVFGGTSPRCTGGRSLGRLLDAEQQAVLGDGLVVNRVGRGVTVTIAADVAASVYQIQHGHSVAADGVPAPDDTAAVDDGILKCDDGIALSWTFDRERTALAAPLPDCPGKHPAYPAGDTPWFARPIADELRELLVRSICWAASAVGIPLPLVAAWPRGLPAVGLISHDSDFNIDASARITLDLLAETEIRSTWCTMEGPTYPDRFLPETFDLIAAAGHESALHYNALDRDGGRWGNDALAAQAAWLRDAGGIAEIASNKNHFTRWEGTVELFRWLEEAGIGSDQSKGPSKKGNVGFLFSSCQPWRPLDLDGRRYLDVIEIPLQTQDLWLTAPPAIAGPILDRAVEHHGVAHFLFHQVHLMRLPDVVAAFRDVVAEGRARGVEWWTGADIAAWTRQRRDSAVTTRPVGEDRWRVRVTAPDAVAGLGIVVVLPERDTAPMAATARWPGGPLETRRTVIHNMPALSINLDHPGGEIELDLAFELVS